MNSAVFRPFGAARTSAPAKTPPLVMKLSSTPRAQPAPRRAPAAAGGKHQRAMDDDAARHAGEHVPADERIAPVAGDEAGPGDHAVRPEAPHRRFEREIEDPEAAGLQQRDRDGREETILPDGGVADLFRFERPLDHREREHHRRGPERALPIDALETDVPPRHHERDQGEPEVDEVADRPPPPLRERLRRLVHAAADRTTDRGSGTT